MKIYKKIGIGLGLTFAVLSVFSFIFLANPSRALAATVDASSFSNAQYVITSFENKRPKTISATIGGVDYIFTDTNTSDSALNLKTSGNTGFICSQSSKTTGINLQEPSKPLPVGGNYYSGQITLNYSGDTNQKCKEGNAQKFLPLTDMSAIYGVPGVVGSVETPGDTNASDCNNIGSSLNWIICPILDPLSNGADQFNNYVSGQLNFSVKDNLPDVGPVHKAWAIFKNLVSAIIVIVLLVMIISQTAGDLISAYTFKKLLPKLVVAVIAMQLSWELCIWLISLANDLGRGVGELLAAPFGGLLALELPNLVNNVSTVAAGAATVVGYSGIITAVIFAGPILIWGWPLLLLTALLIMVALLAALATLLFRNALIVMLVILSPLGFLAWVLPGSNKLWKMWKDNFVKLLLFFPLVMAMIYGGRIFAWIAGQLGTGGPLDLLMVLIGFFGPYFLLPKSFKWGGGFLAIAAKAVDSSFPVKKGREVATRELLGAQRRNMLDYGKANLNPNDPDYVKAKRWHGVPYGYRGKLGKTMMTNLKSGRVIPTRRALGTALGQQDKHDLEETALETAIAERGRKKATSSERNIAAGKDMSVKMVQEGIREAAAIDDSTNTGKTRKLKALRSAKAGLEDLVNSKSFYELAKMQIDEIGENGEVVKDPKTGENKKQFIWQTDLWRNVISGNSQLYGVVSGERPDWTPHRLPSGLPKYRGEISANAGILPDWEERLATSERKKGTPDDQISAKIEERKIQIDLLRSGDTQAQEAEALGEVMAETDSRKLATVSPVMFERIGQMAESGYNLNEEIQAHEAKGEKVEAERLRVKQEMLLKPTKLFTKMVINLVETGNEYQLSQLMGGEDAEAMVDQALQYGGNYREKHEWSPSQPATLISLMKSRRFGSGNQGGGGDSGGGSGVDGGGGDRGGGGGRGTDSGTVDTSKPGVTEQKIRRETTSTVPASSTTEGSPDVTTLSQALEALNETVMRSHQTTKTIDQRMKRLETLAEQGSGPSTPSPNDEQPPKPPQTP